MIRGTTPPYVLTIDGYDLTESSVYVTLRDKQNHLITKTGNELTVVHSGRDSIITFSLTQKETFSLSVGDIEIQVRFINSNGIANATDIVKITNLDVLLNKIISYERDDINDTP